MKHARKILAILALTVTLTQGCDSGGECGACSGVDDCDPGLTCDPFQEPNGNVHYLCAAPDTYSCTVESYYFTGEADGKDVELEPVDTIR